MALNDWLKLMVDKKGSDLFLTVGIPPSIKLHGTIEKISEEPLTSDQVEAEIKSMLNERDAQKFQETRELNFAIYRPELGRFRVSAFQQRLNHGAVLRRIETQIPTIEELNLPPIIKDFALVKRGLILVVGGTGTGKSTTLAAMIGHRNEMASGHVISIEDPIEFIHEHRKCVITQREIGIDTESFEIALKNSLRQAPDVILIGEIRSKEVMQYALSFAETGHLCLATLHANNASQALDRIASFFVDSQLKQLWMDLSLNLKAVVAQLLIPTKDGSGRVPAVEILINTPVISDHIRKGEVDVLKEFMSRSAELEMQTFDDALFKLYSDGKISYESALKYAESENEVRLKIKLKQGSSDAGDFRVLE